MEILDCGHPMDEGRPTTVNGERVMGWRFVLDGERRICHACADKRILECGHTPSPHEPFTTGYGRDADGSRHCYDCCAERERAAMIQTGKTSLYLVKSADGYEATDWPGKLRFKVWGQPKVSWHNFAGRGGRRDFWFPGPDGHLWHGVSIGDMDLARVRRTKQIVARPEAGRAAA